MSSLFAHSCSASPENRLLAIGGTHVFERETSCRLICAEPEDTLKDLDWTDALALEAKREGTAEVACGTEVFRLEIVAPTRLDIEMVDSAELTEIHVQQRFKVQARLYDDQSRELEVGKFTIFEWTSSEVLEIANDRSSGEFGFCDTCYGMHGFRALKAGRGSIEARLDNLQGHLTVIAVP